MVGSDTNPYLQIAEVVAYVNGDSSFSVTYTVKNFRAMFGADLFVEGADVGTGVFSPGPPRFLGGQNPAVGRSGGIIDASPAWSHYQEDCYNQIWDRLKTNGAAAAAAGRSRVTAVRASRRATPRRRRAPLAAPPTPPIPTATASTPT